jgi:hypothetical protein
MTIAPATPLILVMHDGRCLGFLLARGPAGVEAFDHDERSLGFFANERAAVTAVSKSEMSANAAGVP